MPGDGDNRIYYKYEISLFFLKKIRKFKPLQKILIQLSVHKPYCITKNSWWFEHFLMMHSEIMSCCPISEKYEFLAGLQHGGRPSFKLPSFTNEELHKLVILEILS